VHWVQVPIMLRSTYCCLNEHTDKELTDLGECPYDQVRYTATNPGRGFQWANCINNLAFILLDVPCPVKSISSV